MKIIPFRPEDIYRLIAEKLIPSQAWLAEKLNIKASTFNKMLVHGKDIPTEIYFKINEILRREGIITDSSEQCSLLIRQVLSTDTIIDAAMGQLSELTLKLAGDDDLSFDDKNKILNQLDSMEKTITEKIFEIKRLVKGRK